jgi:signal transduction histidine kinase
MGIASSKVRKPRRSSSALPPAKADRALLRQVWLNLISNALKYSQIAQSG